MHEQELLRQIIDTVPHWYQADHGPAEHVLGVGGERVAFKSHTACSPAWPRFTTSSRPVEEWAASLPEVVTIRDLSNVRREVVIAWLRLARREVEWERLFAWADNLEFRTSENRPVTLNLILSPGSGGTDITEVSLQKGLDSIATSGQVFLEVDKQLRFLDYRQITREDICQLPAPAFNPEFLDPFVDGARCRAVVVPYHRDGGHHRPRSRAVSWRRAGRGAGQSAIVRPLTAATSSIFGGVDMATNTLLCALDLSYRRKGALLVFDPDRLVVDHLVECACRLADPIGLPPASTRCWAPGPRPSGWARRWRREHQRKLLLELATLDGAVLFDHSSVLAFGGILHMHDSARGHLGARTTAAYSAYYWGGVPVMISADGEMTIVFTSAIRARERRGTGIALAALACRMFRICAGSGIEIVRVPRGKAIAPGSPEGLMRRKRGDK